MQVCGFIRGRGWIQLGHLGTSVSPRPGGKGGGYVKLLIGYPELFELSSDQNRVRLIA